jgi:hypothetical protein
MTDRPQPARRLFGASSHAALHHPRRFARWGGVARVAAWSMLLAWLPLGPAHAQCGAEGERPCQVTERLPSCDVNLIEAGGRCIRPACGREGEKPCGTERMLFDFVLKAPVPQPCDVNLKLDILQGRCIRPPCGRSRDRACNVLERIPSCDLDLTEVGGRCVRPQCGRLGEAPCRVPQDRLVVAATAGFCDTNLVLDPLANQCRKAGTPPPNQGAAPPQQIAAVPVARAPAPPPPPPGSAPPPPLGLGKMQPLPAVVAPVLPGGAPPSAPAATAMAPGMEPDTDRYGGDFLGFELARADPVACQSACALAAHCRAWTYLKPGQRGPNAQCFLKNTPGTPQPNGCCVSGLNAVPAIRNVR